MTDTIQLQPAEFRARFSALQINVAEAGQGVFTVFTESEPLFCYDATSLDEVEHLVNDTIESYAANFCGLTDIKVDFQVKRPEVVSKVPVERVTPFIQQTLLQAA